MINKNHRMTLLIQLTKTRNEIKSMYQPFSQHFSINTSGFESFDYLCQQIFAHGYRNIWKMSISDQDKDSARIAPIIYCS